MSYKRVVKKKGKSYGPYIYESYRDENGKVQKRYLGKVVEKKSFSALLMFSVAVFMFFLLIGIGYTTDLVFNEGKVSGQIIGFVSETVSSVVDGATGLVVGDGEEELVEEEPVIEVPANEEPIDEESIENETVVEESIENVTEVNETVENITEVNETVVNETVENVTEVNETVVNETVVEESIENITEESVENVTEVNETVENVTETVENVTEVNETVVNETLVNETVQNVTVVQNLTEANVTTLQYKAVIGRPVKWIKTVDVGEGNFSVALPKDAGNISVLTDEEVGEALEEIDEYEDFVDDSDRENIVEGVWLTGNVALDIKSGEGWFTRLWRWLMGFTISGNVILEEEILEDIAQTENATVIDLSDIVGNETEVAVEYYTEAPVANETNLTNGKRVVVHAPDELNYTEILSYAMVDDLKLSMNDSRLKLYWYASREDAIALGYLNESVVVEVEEVVEVNESNETNETFDVVLTANVSLEEDNITVNETNEIVQNDSFVEEVLLALNNSVDAQGIKIEIEYVGYDFDEDGLIDYIEWVVPHLSAQVYEIVLEGPSVLVDEGAEVDGEYTHLKISAEAPYDSLVAYYSFDGDNSTTAFDYAGDNDGAITGAVIGEGKFDEGMVFDGAGDYVDAGSDSSLNVIGDITVSFWVNPAGGISNYTAFLGRGLDDGWGFYGDTGAAPDNIYFRVSTGSGSVTASTSDVLSVGYWTHIVGRYNGSNIDVFGDGVELTSSAYAQTGVMDNSGTTLQIGKISDRATYFFNGSIDEVMIFNKSLTNAEISDLYDTASPRFVTSGKQEVLQQQVMAGATHANISFDDYEQTNGSSVKVALGEWDSSKGYKDYDLGDHALVLDGDDYMTSSLNISEISANNNFSIGLWFNGVEDASWNRIFLESNTVMISFNNAIIRLYVYNETTSSVATITDVLDLNKWYHLFYLQEYNGTHIVGKIYLNGVYQGSHSIAGDKPSNSGTLGLGASFGDGQFNGSIDEVMVFNDTLTDTEIIDLYNKGRDVGYYYYDNLVSWYGFDDGTANDSIGSNDGSFSGNAYVSGNNGLVSYWHMDERGELVVNGGFDDDSDWVAGSDWVIEDGLAKATHDSSNTYNLSQDIGAVAGRTYNLTYTVTSSMACSILYSIGGSTLTVGSVTEGTHSYLVVAVDSDDLIIQEDVCPGYCGGSEHLYIDDVSVKEVVAIDSVGMNDGTLEGNVTYGDGVFGGGFSFDGDGDYVKTSSTTDFSIPNITVSAWVYSNAVGASTSNGADTVVQRYNENSPYGWKLGVDSSGLPSWLYYGSSCILDTITSSGDSVVGGWHHLVGTRKSSGGLELYVDGVSVASDGTTDCSDQTVAEPLKIGRWKDSSTDADFNGSIDEVMIFNRTLSCDEIQELYVKGRANFEVLSEQDISDDDAANKYDYANSEGIVSCWLDGATDSCSDNDGSLADDASWADDALNVRGNSLSLDGDGDYMNISDADSLDADLNGSFTFSMWYSGHDNDINMAPFGKWNIGGSDASYMCSFSIATTDELGCYVTPDGTGASQTHLSGAGTFSAGWHHLVFFYNGTYIGSYQDGIFQNATAHTTGVFDGTYPLIIGEMNHTAATDWNGSIDEVAIWNRALSTSEIEEVYRQSKDLHSNNEFEISTSTTNVLPILKLVSSASNFYSPLAIARSAVSSIPSVVQVLDLTAPSVTVNSPVNDSVSGRNVSISASASDEGNVSLFNDYGLVSWWRMDDEKVELGEMTINGDFENGDDGSWGNTGEWVIGAGEEGTSLGFGTEFGNLSQNIGVEIGRTYNLIYTITRPVGGTVSMTPYLGGIVGTTRMSAGTYAENFTVVTAGNLTFAGSISASVLTLDDVSVEEINVGRVEDYIGDNNGVKVGGVRRVEGRTGKGFEFDGDGDYVDIEKTMNEMGLSTTGNLSLSAWFKTSESGEQQYIINNYYYGWVLQLDTSNKLMITNLDNAGNEHRTTKSSATVNDGEWHHAFATVYGDGSNSTLYLDGVSQTVITSDGIVGQIFDDGYDIMIGKRSISADSYFNGSLDDIMIWNRSLSEAEVFSLYANISSKYLDSSMSMEEGVYDITYYAQDSDGNVGSAVASGITVDLTAPNVSYDASTDSGTINRDNIFVNVSVSDENNVSTFVDFDNSLVSWWRMDDGNSTHVFDYMGRNNGSVEGDAAQVDDGYFGKGFSFDGDDYVDCGEFDATESVSEFTVSVWVKSNDDTTSTHLIEKADGAGDDSFKLRFQSTHLVFEVWNSSGSEAESNYISAITDKDWHHLAGVYNGTHVTSYIDNDVGTSAVLNGGVRVTTNNLIIGGHSGSLVGFWNGSIDDVMIFNRSLSAEEIVGIYANTSSKYMVNNYTGLDDGAHTFKGYAQDQGGNVVSLSERSLVVDTTEPAISYDLSSDTGGFVNRDSVFVNVSSNDSEGNVSTFIDWDNSLVSWWRMDDVNATHVMDYLSGNDGLIVGNAIQVDDGYFGKGFSFDGDGDWFNIGNDASFQFVNDTAFSLSVWVKRNSAGSTESLFSKISEGGTGYSLMFSGNELEVILVNDWASLNRIWIQTIDTYTDISNWHHVLFSYDGLSDANGVKIYYDGVSQSLDVRTNSLTSTFNISRNLNIGARHDGTSATPLYLNGSLDDVMIFNRSLSAEEVAGLYANTSSKYIEVNYTGLSDRDYGYNAYVQDMVGNVVSAGVRSVSVNDGVPSVEYSVAPENDSYSNVSSLFVNVSFSDVYPNNITFALFNSTGEVNVTTYSMSDQMTNTSINWTVGVDGLYYYNVSVYDGGGRNNFTETREIVIDTTVPVVTLDTSYLPEDNSVGGSSIVFNWTVNDNLDTSILCNTLGGVDGTTVLNSYYVLNDSVNVESEILTGGIHKLSVSCSDGASVVHSSDVVNYLVAVINYTEPVEGLIVRRGDTSFFRISELIGVDYLTAANVTIDNSSGVQINGLMDNVLQTHNFGYTWGLEPSYISARVTAYNDVVGAGANVSDVRNLVLLRASENTSEPVLNNACPNETYVVNGSDVLISLISDLDTLILSENVTVVAPDASSYELDYDSRLIDSSGYMNYYNYTFEVNQSGVYSVYANVTDYENHSSSWNYSFYSSVGYGVYRINSSATTNIERIGKCSGDVVSEGNDLTMRLARGSLIDLNVSIDKTLHNLSLEFRDVNLTGNLSEVVGYAELSNETDAPSTDRKVALFELNSTLNFSNYTFVYDYTTIAHTINNESSLKVYKCEDILSCGLVDTEAVVDVGNNTLTVTLDSFSYFMITESGTSVETVTETVSGGGSTTTETVYRSLNILTPGEVEIGLTDQVVIPVTLDNPEDIVLKDISLTANSTTNDIDPEFEPVEINELGAGENETVMLFLESHSTPGEYEIHLEATVSEPEFIETAVVYVRLVAMPGMETVVERIVLAQDLFRENPQCLELNDLLIRAQELIDEGRVEEARVIVQQTIYKCKELVTGEEFPLSLVKVREWRDPIMIALGLIIIAAFIVILIRRPKFDLYKSKKEKKKWWQLGKKKKKKSKGKNWLSFGKKKSRKRKSAFS